jgi:serine/threonine-protein kinase
MVAVLLILALLSIGGPTAYLHDPDRAIRRIESELARGQAVDLIGLTGGPKWSRWRAGGASSHTALAADGTFTIDSWTHGLLELVPDPPSDHYRITAQVRHDKGDRMAAVGLYFAHKVYPVGPTPLQFFSQLTFNSTRREADFRVRRPPDFQAGQPPTFTLQGPVRDNAPQLFPHFITDEVARPGFDRRLAGIDGPPFKAVGETNVPWHHLELIVTPERVTARWDGQPFGMDAAKLRDNIHWDLTTYPPPPGARLPRGFVPPFEERGGLGLYVFRGSASFRAVTITPL